MKQLIQVRVKAVSADPLKLKADILAIGLFEQKKLAGLADEIDRRLGGAISALIRLGDFTGKAKTSALLYTQNKLPAKRLLLVGLGEKSKADIDTLRTAAQLSADKAVELGACDLLVCIGRDIASKNRPEQIARALTEGLCFGAYRYDEYLTESNAQKPRPAVLKAVIADSSAAFISRAKKGIATGLITGSAQNLARTLANRPANVISPQSLAAEGKAIARNFKGLRCSVMDERKLAEKKMGGILAVGKGSTNKPRLIIIEYRPSKITSKTPVVGLVGKAITFDSGGISIKPSEGMQDMKFDKSGGIAVMAAMSAVARLKPAVRVLGIVPAAENMPSGGSYRPGDIITTYSGKTVEIHSTDAEGRMLLCDAIAFAEELGCGVIVDIATLTGACVVALGKKRAGLMGNDARLIEQIKDASQQTGERLWHLPCDDEFVEAMKSKIADLKNTGGRWGGACTAAAFLSRFVKKAKWAHVDMAGVGVWGEEKGQTPGSVGFGVRLLTEFVMAQR